MITEAMRAGIVSMRPFVPAKDFEGSAAFYEALGFRAEPLGPDLKAMQLGAFSFLLQKFYVKEFAENFMMHMFVEDLDAWWAHIAALDLAARFGVPAPRAPELQPWGLRVSYVVDPAGVLWHVAGRGR